MQRFALKGAVLAMALAITGPALAEDPVTADTIVATVNGEAITIGHLLVARSTLPEQYQQLPNDVLLPGLIEQLIQQTALSQALGDDLAKRDRLALANQVSGYRAGVVLNRIAETPVSEDAVKAVYEEQFLSAAPDMEFNASHILVETEEEAIEVKAMVDAEGDFGELAKMKSTGPSGPNGGELGWFGKGMMVPEFEAAVLTLKPGEVSAPVRTQFGWHIVKLNETRSKDVPDLAQVRDQIEQELRSAAVEDAIKAEVAAAEVVQPEGLVINPDVLSNFSLLNE